MIRILYSMVPAALLLAVCSTALAHRLDADYVQTDQGYRIEFFLGDGSPGADLAITAQPAGGQPIHIGWTDDQGAILFVPPAPGEWTIVGSGTGHSTSRNPLVLRVPGPASRTAAAGKLPNAADSPMSESASPASESVPPPDRAPGQGRFPWPEVVISLGFITFLTLVTLGMMQRSARQSGRPAEVEQLAHEVDHLRAAVARLREEVAALKEHREVRS